MQTGNLTGRIRDWWKRLGHRFSTGFGQGPALLRRMGIPLSDVNPDRRGFVVVQIDGLSYGHLLTAMKQRKLPFVRKLHARGELRLHRFQSEIPTSTPAFQAGLFYGDNENIPGFQFYDRPSRRHFRMGRSEFAHDVQSERANPGVLRGGSVFSCVFTGDAEASMFIFSTLLAPHRWKFVFRVWDILLLSFMNISIFFRILVLGAVELVLAVYDMVKWYLKRGIVRRELEFIGARIALTVIGRETITLGAVIDIFRGVPSVYVNYLGYDEHSHLRGPESKVAYWTLRGIDRSIRRIHKAVCHAERKYDVFILSDHGQVRTRPFEVVVGKTLGDFVKERLAGLEVASDSLKDERAAHLARLTDGLERMANPMPRAFRRPLRAYARFLQRRIGTRPLLGDPESRQDVIVVSSGPIAYLYWTRFDEPLTAEEIDEMHPNLLDEMAASPGIGFVSVRTQDGGVLLHSATGQMLLTEDEATVSGVLPFDKSLFRAHVLAGVRRVTLMPRAGDICIWGGYAPGGHISYSYEFGAHSGCSDEEISAFILAPPTVDFDFAGITRHAQFYELFSRYLEDPPQAIPPVAAAAD